ncbi:MAG: DUF89 family protein [Chloroflexi bacterium]|jgi:damage-control phosphatase, subfamily I|nr:DUF89 family protein [Chloroflexota bacterium]
MKITNECYDCLSRLVHQAADLATKDPELKVKAIEQGQNLLNCEFSLDKTSIAVATPLHRAIRDVTGNADPYLQMKETEVAMARDLYQDLVTNYQSDLKRDVVLAVRGNSIDFFVDFAEIKQDLISPVEFAIDDTDKLEAKLKDARNILYLADNTGEVFFDLHLVRRLGDFGSVTYVVKESPVQNDVSLSDLQKFGLAGGLPRVITTGTDTPGVLMEMASDQFLNEFTAADFVLAKGMGYWETLSELPAKGKVFHLLKAKCEPVANSLGVPLNSYIALLR